MRIGLAVARYPPYFGGVETHVAQIAPRLAALGHEVEVLTHLGGEGAARSDDVDGVRIRRFPVPVSSDNYAVAPGLFTHLRGHSTTYDVIHTHGYHALPPLWAALARRGPIVFTPHYHGTGHSPFRKLLHPPYRRTGGRLVLSRADQVICVSEPEAQLLLGHFPDVRDRLTVVPNGVDIDLLLAAEPFEHTGTVLLSAGRIESYKNVDLTVRALKHMNSEYTLRVTGDGPARGDVEAVVQREGLSDRVTFLGRVSDEELRRWFRTAKVFVSMSTNEAMPITLIEVLAAGAAVAASDIPAHRDLAEHTGGEIELVSPSAPPEELAARIESLASRTPRHPDVRSWEEVTDRTVEVYERALNLARA